MIVMLVVEEEGSGLSIEPGFEGEGAAVPAAKTKSWQ